MKGIFTWRIVAAAVLALATVLGKAGVIPPVVPAILGPVVGVLLPDDAVLAPDGETLPEPFAS